VNENVAIGPHASMPAEEQRRVGALDVPAEDVGGDGVTVFDGQGRLIGASDEFRTANPALTEHFLPGRRLRDILVAAAMAGVFGPLDGGVAASVDDILARIDAGAGQVVLLRTSESRLLRCVRQPAVAAEAGSPEPGEPAAAGGLILVQDGTARLRAEARAARADATAEAAEAHLRQFVGVAAHDLKAPLRNLGHLIGWMREDLHASRTAEVDSHLGAMQGQVGRLRRLIERLYDYFELLERSQPVELVDSRELVEAVLAELSVSLDRCAVGAEMPHLWTARLPLERVFRNLIDNAFKYGGDGVRVRVDGRLAGDEACFTVADDGPGIPPERRDKALRFFTRLGAPSRIEGSGLGLGLVSEMVHRHGGRIAIEDPPEGRGTLVRFTWRTAPPDVPDQPAEPS